MADQKAKEMEPVETQIVEIMPPDIELKYKYPQIS